MEQIQSFLISLFPENFDFEHFFKAALVLALGLLVFGTLGRLLFGKKSVLNQSVSALIGILFIYATTIVAYSYGLKWDFLISPLPFISLEGEALSIFNVLASDYTTLCGHLLNMIILAFLVNLVNSWLPKSKKLFGWLFFRCVSVIAAMALFTFVNRLLSSVLPSDLLKWAPVILLGILVLSLALGALKFLVGAVLTTINPLIAVLYTFFFASVLGKQVSKAILTTVLATGLVALLNYLGITGFFIGAAALTAYIPVLIVLLALWYFIGHIL